MRHERNYHLLGVLLVSVLLLTTACAGLSDLDAAKIESSAKKTVTVTVLTESQQGGMRANTVSDGKKAMILICAIYKVNGSEYDLVTDAIQTGQDEVTGVENGEGQYLFNFSKDQEKTIELQLDESSTYRMAFWAQSLGAEAYYTTTDLEDVKVKYTKDDSNTHFMNNDENRDAFCKFLDIKGSTEKYEVKLYRPFAQINVGTTGADYKNILKNPTVFNNMEITRSKIELRGVATSINVVTGKVDDTSTSLTNVTFDFATIPAFMNMGEQLPKDLVGGKELGDDDKKAKGYRGNDTEEEFLFVNLDGKEGYQDYKVSYPTLDASNNYLTETFKYLSMCYVLVPEETDVPEGMKAQGYSSVLSEVKVSFAESDGESSITPINLNYIPVKRNWRTNILGGLKYMKDPTDPEEPDPDEEDPDEPGPGPDDTSVFGSVKFTIDLSPLYDGEYNGTYNGNNQWTDYPTSSDPTAEEEEEEEEGVQS